METLRKALKSKTVIFGIILAALSALQGFVLTIDLEPKTQALAGFGLSAIIIVLRFLTNGSIDEK
jgi:hypothetical protein